MQPPSDNANQILKQGRKSLVLELLILSAVSLYLEVLLIRWLSADVRAFSAFRTFPLVTCFIGLGVGFSLGKDRFFSLAPVFLLISVCAIKAVEFLNISLIPFPTNSITSWGQINGTGLTFATWVFFLAQVLFCILAGPFAAMVCIGERLGVLFNKVEKPLTAYCINIFGAILGSIVLTVLSFYEISPFYEMIPVMLVLGFYVCKLEKKALLATAVSLIALIVIGLQNRPVEPNSRTIWSPYQRLDLVPILGDQNEVIGHHLLSNRIPYQSAMDLSEANIAKIHATKVNHEALETGLRRYEMPYKLAKNLDDVLIVGSGMGNDVTTALRYHAKSIDAVELDPSILKLGRTVNPANPYESPLVHAHCDDARHFFNATNKHYDLVVLSHLDSGYVVGQGSCSRVDNYVYTRESIARALTLLKPNGILVLSYFTVKPWFNDRLLRTTTAGATYQPLEFADSRDLRFANTYYVLGAAVKNHTFELPAELVKFAHPPVHDPQPVKLLTDDWPFLYVTPGTFDLPYLFVLAETLLIALLLGRRFLTARPGPEAGQMFFLGAGFMLLELQAISRLARLFGSTWLTSSLVINGVLIMILMANFFVIKNREVLARRVNLLYILLGASLLTSFFLPVNQILLSVPSGEALVAFLTVLPMFFAAMIFACSFAKVASSSSALAYNLFGAVLGSLLEYAANYVGINKLVLIALVLYALSWFVIGRRINSAKPIDAP